MPITPQLYRCHITRDRKRFVEYIEAPNYSIAVSRIETEFVSIGYKLVSVREANPDEAALVRIARSFDAYKLAVHRFTEEVAEAHGYADSFGELTSERDADKEPLKNINELRNILAKATDANDYTAIDKLVFKWSKVVGFER